MEPIYFIVAENGPMAHGQIYWYKILACEEGTMDQYYELSKRLFDPLYHGGNFRAQILIFQREPDNPFRDQVFQQSHP